MSGPGSEPRGRVDPGRLAHLAEHRRLIIERSLLAGVVGVVPIPLLDELVTSLVRARLMRRLAELRQVDLGASAVLILSEQRQVTMGRYATLTAVSLVAIRYAWRKAFVALALGRRVEEALHTFQAGTLFDHYCAKHYQGGPLEGTEAARIRFVVDHVGTTLHHDLAVRAFRQAVGTLGRAVTRVPRGLVRLLRRRPRVPAEELVDEVAAGLEEEGVLGQAGREVEEALGRAPYVELLVERFDATWAQLVAQVAAEQSAAGGAVESPGSGTAEAPAGEAPRAGAAEASAGEAPGADAAEVSAGGGAAESPGSGTASGSGTAEASAGEGAGEDPRAGAAEASAGGGAAEARDDAPSQGRGGNGHYS